MKLIIYLVLVIALFCISSLLPTVLGGEDKDKVWYKIDISSTANPIYVDYLSIKKGDKIAKYEQLEFLNEKQKLDGTDKEYQFVISKREVDCKNKKYLIKEEKFYDSELNFETDEVTEKIVHKIRHGDSGAVKWRSIDPDTPLEKVLKFVCLYKDNKN